MRVKGWAGYKFEGSAMRGPRVRDRAGGWSDMGSGEGFSGGGFVTAGLVGGATVKGNAGAGAAGRALDPERSGKARSLRRRRFGRETVRCSTTSRTKLPMVSTDTETSMVDRSSRMSRYEAPFWRSSTMPSLNGNSFEYRLAQTGVNVRTASVKRAVCVAMLAF